MFVPLILVSLIVSWYTPETEGALGLPQSRHISPGILKLIVKAYIDDILKADVGDQQLKNRLQEMSDHVASHPALYQKHLFVGHQPPLFDPDIATSGNAAAGKQLISKRQEATSSQFPSEEICSTISQWEQINSTNDFNNNPVEVVQEEGLQQYVFTYRCARTKVGPCTGISPLYQSECTERFGWMYMYYRKSPTETPIWGYVEAPHHCACKIQPKIGVLTTPAEE